MIWSGFSDNSSVRPGWPPAPLPLRVRLRQTAARRRLAAVPAVLHQTTLKLGDPLLELGILFPQFQDKPVTPGQTRCQPSILLHQGGGLKSLWHPAFEYKIFSYARLLPSFLTASLQIGHKMSKGFCGTGLYHVAERLPFFKNFLNLLLGGSNASSQPVF